MLQSYALQGNAWKDILTPHVSRDISSTKDAPATDQHLPVGEILNAPSSPSVLLLPGQYSTSTSPQLLHNMLTSSQASLAPQAGFGNASRSSSTIPLPLSIQMQPGVVVYTDSLYGGQGFFSSISESPASLNGTLKPLNGASLSISSNTWAALEVGSGSTLIVWSSIPDFSQLPPTASSGSFSLLDIQSGACSPPCAGAGVCSLSGTCTCPTGFTGQSCETCADGFFGPDCLPCPADCETCDSGPTGTGKCLVPAVANAPSTCNCLNGVCGSNGSCTCNAGWTAASNGTACAACAKGFFLSSSGNCQGTFSLSSFFMFKRSNFTSSMFHWLHRVLRWFG